MTKDPYSVLGLSPSASPEDITKAYRALVKLYHPDLNQGDTRASEKMLEINSAYEELKNKKEEELAEAQTPPLVRAKRLLDMGNYEDAGAALSEYPPPRNAEWYCLGAVAAYGLGESKTALEYAKKAVALRPENAEYQRVLRNVKAGQKAARREERITGTPLFSCGTIFALIIFIGLLCMYLFSPLFEPLRWWQA